MEMEQFELNEKKKNNKMKKGKSSKVMNRGGQIETWKQTIA